MSDNQTIFALSSGAGRAGVAIVRVSGAQAHPVAQRLAGVELQPRRATRAVLKDVSGEILDDALLLFFKAPHSFTGDDVLEIHSHGSPAVVKALLHHLGNMDECRPAEPGEFTRRAFLNGKQDLTQVEGLSALLQAETALQHRFAVQDAFGASRARYERWRRDLLKAMALLEAHMDFVDEEDVPPHIVHEAQSAARDLRADIKAHLATSIAAERVRDGLSVVIAGAPNAGKSSLLNALSRRDVAIVSAEPGTTRDVLEVRLDLAGMPLNLFDTAGLRLASNAVETEGVRRAKAALDQADLVLWLRAPDVAESEPPPFGAAPVWLVETKKDLAPLSSPHHVAEQFGQAHALSSHSGAGLGELLDALKAYAAGAFNVIENAHMLNARQRRALEEAHTALGRLNETQAPEIQAEYLREAAQALGLLTGQIGAEDVLGEIFSTFCIGK